MKLKWKIKTKFNEKKNPERNDEILEIGLKHFSFTTFWFFLLF